MSLSEEKRTREQKERMERVERPNAVKSAALSTRLDALKAESGVLRGQIAEIDKQVCARVSVGRGCACRELAGSLSS